MRVEAAAPGGGFTLIELLVVLGIIAVLLGLVTPLLGIARTSAAKTNTTSLLRKIDGGLHLFRIDVGAFPYQEWSTAASPPPAADTTPPVNQLAYHLCHDATSAEQTALRTDVDAAGNLYEVGGSARVAVADYNARGYTSWVSSAASVAPVAVFHLNRLARQWARVNLMAGNTQVKKPVKSGTAPWIEGATLLPAATTKGYCFDYLSRDIPPRQRAGDAVVDLWGNPVVYICPVLPGTVGYYGEGLGDNMVDPTWFGFAPRSLRSATTALASDLRTTAASRFTFLYETWSRGPDGLISSLRDAQANRDNIPAEAYNKELR